MANTSVGFEAATTGTPLSRAITITLWCRAVVSGITPDTDEIDAHGVEVDELQAHLLGHPPHEIGLADQLLVGQDAGDALAGEVVLLERQAHGFERDPSAVDQCLGQRGEAGQCPRRTTGLLRGAGRGRWRRPRRPGRRRRWWIPPPRSRRRRPAALLRPRGRAPGRRVRRSPLPGRGRRARRSPRTGPAPGPTARRGGPGSGGAPVPARPAGRTRRRGRRRAARWRHPPPGPRVRPPVRHHRRRRARDSGRSGRAWPPR